MNKIPHQVRTIGWLLLLFTFIFTDCPRDEDEPPADAFPDISIKAAVFNDCHPSQNFSSTHVFAESLVVDGIKRFVVGGYNFDDSKELGFILPWPPVKGIYTLGGNSWAYYDPYVNENDTNNYLDQFATNYVEGTKIYIKDVLLINDLVINLDLRFDSIGVVNSSDEYMCLTVGQIWMKDAQ